jgi:hypothetical protein
MIESQIEELRVIPDFVQTPTGFNSYSIQANTSRYFSQRTQATITAGTDVYVMTLYNNGVHDRVVRISGVALSSFSDGYVSQLRLSFYKDSTLTAPSFSSITGSDIEIDTTGSAVLGTQVFDVYGASGGNPAYPKSLLKFIPKEVYSVILAPGEVVTITDTSTTNHTLLCSIMWEEIIN